jgi:hypothetical protein
MTNQVDDPKRHGFKFLTPYGSTIYHNRETVYPIPRPDEKWGPWFYHPAPATPDGMDCGPGRWHVMLKPSANYAPTNWWVWYAEGKGIVGESTEKFGCTAIRLRRITQKMFWRMIRLGWCKRANLYKADLHRADLGKANLRGADLQGADLQGTNLQGVNLEETRSNRYTIWPEGWPEENTLFF